MRLHGQDGGRFRIIDSKTETGVREVQMTPDLASAVSAHIQRLRRVNAPTTPIQHAGTHAQLGVVSLNIDREIGNPFAALNEIIRPALRELAHTIGILAVGG